MTPEIYEDMTASLKREPQPLSQLHTWVKEAGSDWSVDQLQLFLTCMDGVKVETEDGRSPTVGLGEQSREALLLAAVVEVVKSQGSKPIPAAQVLRLLPSQFVTTEAQIKALVKGSSELEVFGPGLLRLKG